MHLVRGYRSLNRRGILAGHVSSVGYFTRNWKCTCIKSIDLLNVSEAGEEAILKLISKIFNK